MIRGVCVGLVLSCTVLLLSVVGGCAGRVQQSSGSGMDVQKKAGEEGSSMSGLDLGLSLMSVQWEGGSVCFSPWSIQRALRLAAAGAAGETQGQLLHVSGGAGDSVPVLPSGSGVELVEADAVWVDEGTRLSASYSESVRSRYGASVRSLPIRRDASGAAERINDWVRESTRGMIGHLLEGGDLGPDTDLVLTNAVYFKGRWDRPFDPHLVEEKPFYSSSGVRSVPMMQSRDRYYYWEGSGVQLVRLPYADGRHELVLILPREGASRLGLDGLSSDSVARWVAHSEQVEVVLSVPRFRVSGLFDLTQGLRALGMELPFGSGADFSPMTGEPNGLSIGSVLHNAVIEVNEEGTEAAAATGVVMLRASLAQVSFTADRPFLYVLYDRDPSDALFVGCYDPQ